MSTEVTINLPDEIYQLIQNLLSAASGDIAEVLTHTLNQLWVLFRYFPDAKQNYLAVN